MKCIMDNTLFRTTRLSARELLILFILIVIFLPGGGCEKEKIKENSAIETELYVVRTFWTHSVKS